MRRLMGWLFDEAPVELVYLLGLLAVGVALAIIVGMLGVIL